MSDDLPDVIIYTDGGCDPIYIARRVVRMAVEDIGIADPRALEAQTTVIEEDLPLVGIGFLMSMNRKKNLQNWGYFIIGFAVLFIGLQFLQPGQ